MFKDKSIKSLVHKKFKGNYVLRKGIPYRCRKFVVIATENGLNSATLQVVKLVFSTNVSCSKKIYKVYV